MTFEQDQAERDANVKKLFTLSGTEKLVIAAAVFLWAALLNSPLMDVNLAASVVNQQTDCLILPNSGPCKVTGPEIRSAN